MSIPTTAGTGSEVGRSTVVSDDETHVKKIIFSPRLLAARVFIDPELTLGLPAGVTAATGMDAVTHLVESYLAKGFHPLGDGIALEGMRLVAKNLVRCVEFARRIEKGERDLVANAEHLEARGHDADGGDDGRRRLSERAWASPIPWRTRCRRWPTCTMAWPTASPFPTR